MPQDDATALPNMGGAPAGNVGGGTMVDPAGTGGLSSSQGGTSNSGGTASGQGGALAGAGGASTDAGGPAIEGGGGASFDPNRPVTVWLAGDSTVANGSAPCAGWGKYFDALFDDLVSVTNSAVGGRSVRTWMYHVQTAMDADGECVLERDQNGNPTLQPRWQDMLDGMGEGDALLIQFGINDGSSTCDRHVGLEAFKESYGVLAQAATARGAVPVFITPVSAIACTGSSPRGTRGGYVDATFEAGEQYGVPVIDLHQRSIELYDALGFCPIPGGSDVTAQTGGAVGAFFCDDHTHFSESGAAEIARLVAEGLDELELELARHLQ